MIIEEVLAVTVIAFVGLMEVTLAHALIAQDAGRTGGRAETPATGPV